MLLTLIWSSDSPSARTTRSTGHTVGGLGGSARTRVGEGATSTSITPYAVGAGATPLTRDRDTTKESCKDLLSSDSTCTVVGTTSHVDSTTRVNDEGLEVGSTLGEQLASVNGRTSNNGRVVDSTGAEDCVVRGLSTRSKEEVGDTADVRLARVLAEKENRKENVQRRTQECDKACCKQ